MFSVIIRYSLLLLCVFILSGCATRQPKDVSDICKIFDDKPRWYKAAKKSSAAWGGPIYLPMAIMYQESSFKAKARPKMEYFLGVIPTGRASNAYGYSQALKSTWADYQKDIGTKYRDRDNFSNAYDFIQWYMDKTNTRNKISKWDGYAQYLNYHEGHAGYARGSHQSKQWLIDVAKRVDARSKLYAQQLRGCVSYLDSKKTGWF